MCLRGRHGGGVLRWLGGDGGDGRLERQVLWWDLGRGGVHVHTRHRWRVRVSGGHWWREGGLLLGVGGLRWVGCSWWVRLGIVVYPSWRRLLSAAGPCLAAPSPGSRCGHLVSSQPHPNLSPILFNPSLIPPILVPVNPIPLPIIPITPAPTRSPTHVLPTTPAARPVPTPLLLILPSPFSPITPGLPRITHKLTPTCSVVLSHPMGPTFPVGPSRGVPTPIFPQNIPCCTARKPPILLLGPATASTASS